MTMPEEFDERARAAAAGLRRSVALEAPELTELVRGSKLRRAGRLMVAVAILVALAGVGLAAASVTTSGDLRWVVTVVLWVLAAGTCLLCAHAGGHAWFVPLPAVALAVLWTVAGVGQRAAGWWLVAACGAAVALGAGVAITALRLRLRGSWAGLPSVVNATGSTLTPLTPVGVARVNGESWTAVSLSGPLPAGVPVHVVGVRGMRLEVWSEAGTVACLEDLETEEGQS
jgi:membrane-bound ClpP family serine protease